MDFTAEAAQQLVIILLFVWSLINLMYYASVERTKPNWWYVIAFAASIVYQIIFYVLVFMDRSGIYSADVGYLTELSYKRNLLFAVLAVIVSVDMALRAKRERKIAKFMEEK